MGLQDLVDQLVAMQVTHVHSRVGEFILILGEKQNLSKEILVQLRNTLLNRIAGEIVERPYDNVPKGTNTPSP